MQVGYHHHQKSKNKKNLTHGQKFLNKFMDDIIYVMGTVGAFIFVPQLINVWQQQNISGVSLLSWVGLFAGSSFWIFYGFIHKAKPIIYANILSGAVQLFIIIGILVH